MNHCERLRRIESCFSIVTCLTFLASVPASAGPGRIRLFTDANGNCDLLDAGGFIQVHVYHEFRPGEDALAARFSIPAPSAWIYAGFWSANTVLGAANSDLSVAYGECLSQTTEIGYVQYFSTQPTPPCSDLRPAAAQGQFAILAVDCQRVEAETFGTGLVINPVDVCCCLCISTEQSTWGSVKALYK